MGNKCCKYLNLFSKTSSNSVPRLISYTKTDLPPITNEPEKSINNEKIEFILTPTEINKQKSSDRLSEYSNTSIIENYIIVCLISNENENLLNYFQENFNSFRLFTNIDEFFAFIIHPNTEKLFLILSDLFAQNILSFIHKISQIQAIYIISNDLKWLNQYEKIKGVFPDIQSICEQLKSILYLSEDEILPIEIVNSSSIIIQYLIKKILLNEINYTDKLKNEFIQYSQDKYPNELNIIHEFKETYTSSKVLWWYTRKCFIYSLINEIFRTNNLKQLIQIGFFIRDLHEKIEMNHIHLKIIYRGQGILENDLELFKKNQNHLCIFKNFLWTNIDRQKSLNYARLSRNNPNYYGILFRIEINSQISTILLEKCNNHLNSNHEYLFSFNYLFRINDIKEIEEKIWEIHLILINDPNTIDDLQLINYIEGETSWQQLGYYFIQLNQYNKAEELYKILIEFNLISNSKQLNLCYQQLGNLYYKTNDLINSLIYYKKLLNIENDFNLFETYFHIALIYYQQKNFLDALKYFKYALNISLHSLPLDHIELANIYHYIANIYDEQGIFIDAIQYYQLALENELNQTPLQYLTIAKTYNKIGEIFYQMKDYTTSFSYFDKTLKIQKQTLSPNHSLLAITNYNIALTLDGLQQYKEAIEYASRALNIARHSFGSDHQNVKEYEEYLDELRQKTSIGVIPNGSVYE